MLFEAKNEISCKSNCFKKAFRETPNLLKYLFFHLITCMKVTQCGTYIYKSKFSKLIKSVLIFREIYVIKNLIWGAPHFVKINNGFKLFSLISLEVNLKWSKKNINVNLIVLMPVRKKIWLTCHNCFNANILQVTKTRFLF